MSKLSLRPHGESGAVAVTVALLSVVLVGIGAFTIDFGMKYTSTRQLQTSSDAAALAAASYLKNQPGTCATITASAALTGQAQSTADAIREANRPGSTRDDLQISCINSGRVLQVRYVSGGNTPTFLGGLLGRSQPYQTSRPATAVVTVPDSSIGVRPYAICAGQIPTTALPTPVFKMSLPNVGNSLCPGADSSGNWWSVDCPEAASNSTSALGQATADGCTDPITIVPNQVLLPPALPRTPIGLRTYLEGYCPARSSSCLSANPGNLRGTPIINAWTDLVDKAKPIILPVFCAGLPVGKCDQSAVVNAGGNNAIYPVHALIGVEVCGFHWGSQDYDAGMPGSCGANNPLGLRSSQGDNQDNYLLLRAVPVTIPGGSSTPGTCAIGDPTCDFGMRKVFLTE